jgi:hypothetical protein
MTTTSTTRAGAVALAVTALLALGACASEDDADTTAAPESEAETTEPTNPSVEGEGGEVDDATITECVTDAAGMVARITVTNDSSKRSTYFIDATFESPTGDQLATGTAIVDNLEPGQSTTTEAHSFTSAPAAFECRLVSVDRSEAL